MFFWKFTRSGKYSSRYISLIMDFHFSNIIDGFLKTNILECEDILCLIHDVESLNGEFNYSSGLEKTPFQQQVNRLGYKATNKYVSQRNEKGLVLGQMTLGIHGGEPLDYGLSDKESFDVFLDTNNLKVSMIIDAKTGIIYGYEDKLKAYRNDPHFINEGTYFDLMPMHSCVVEIVEKMLDVDYEETIRFLEEVLMWEKL